MDIFKSDKFKAILTRAIHTFFQTLSGFVVVGYAFDQIDWKTALSVSLVSFIASIAKSLAVGTPETNTMGTLEIDTSDPDVNRYLMEFDVELEELANKKAMLVKINPTADLSSKTTEGEFDIPEE